MRQKNSEQDLFEKLRRRATEAGVVDPALGNTDLAVLSDLITTMLDGLRAPEAPDKKAVETAIRNLQYAIREFGALKERSINITLLQSVVNDLEGYLRDN